MHKFYRNHAYDRNSKCKEQFYSNKDFCKIKFNKYLKENKDSNNNINNNNSNKKIIILIQIILLTLEIIIKGRIRTIIAIIIQRTMKIVTSLWNYASLNLNSLID